MTNTGPRAATVGAHRRFVVHGERVTYRVSYRGSDGGVRFSVRELPGVTGTTTGRKGLQRAARQRIALELDVAEDAFALVLERER
jgi:hypothetical protein